jgi:channel protein (hemolysin III family)
MSDISAIPGFAEPVSSWTHLAAAGVFFFLSISLLRRGGTSAGHFISLFIFGFSCVFLLSMSGVYHLLPKTGAGSLVLERLDHAAIFVLIAGTITAVHTIFFSGIWRWGIIAAVWAVVATSITLKTIFFSAIPELLGLIVYLTLGWLGVISAIALWRKYGFSFIRPLVFGGLAYTFGSLFEFLRQPVLIEGVVGPHELFHVAVLVGISFHWWFVYRSLKYESTATVLAE